jgi:predicted transcriptional regulator
MQCDVVAVSPDLSLRELVQLFAEMEVSGAPVIAGSKVIGVISTTDIYDFREEMSGTTLGSSVGLGDLDGPPRRRTGYSSFVQSWDPGEVEALEWMGTTRDRDWDVLDTYSVADAMTREVLSQPSDATIKKAAQYMLDAGIHRILVIDDGELQGIVTTTDIVRAVAESKLKG